MSMRNHKLLWGCYTLDDKQRTKLTKWAETLAPADTGAIGGRFTYQFTPTGIDTIVKVVDNVTGQSVDLTDYDSW